MPCCLLLCSSFLLDMFKHARVLTPTFANSVITFLARNVGLISRPIMLRNVARIKLLCTWCVFSFSVLLCSNLGFRFDETAGGTSFFREFFHFFDCASLQDSFLLWNSPEIPEQFYCLLGLLKHFDIKLNCIRRSPVWGYILSRFHQCMFLVLYGWWCLDESGL